MNRPAAATLAALVMLPAAVPLVAQAGSPSVTLFNSGRALVRRTLPIAVPAGNSSHPLVLGLFDPSTLTLLDPGVQLGRITFDAAFNETALLRRHIGELFNFQMGEGKPVVSARLVAVDPERWELQSANGTMSGVVFNRPGQILWDPALVPAAPIADLTLRSEQRRDQLSVMYEAPGGSWNASYRIFLGDRGRIEGLATIDAGTLDLANAEVQLLAGEIGRKVQAPSPRPMMAMARESGQADMAGFGTNEAVGEARLYTLPGRVTFVPTTRMVLPLFEPAPVAPELRLTIPGSLPFYGGFGQETDEREVPVLVSYRLAHEHGSVFGDLALPAGGVSVYDTDAAGRVQLVGNGALGHVAAGVPVEVNTGMAFDVTARRTQTEYTTVRTEKPSRTTATVGYQVVVQNAKDSAVTVEVREDRGGEWQVISSSVAAVRKSASRTVFTLRVPAKGEASLTYRLRVVW